MEWNHLQQQGRVAELSLTGLSLQGLKCCTTRDENGEDVLNGLKRDICIVGRTHSGSGIGCVELREIDALGAVLAVGLGAVVGYTVGKEAASHYYQLYRDDAMASQVKFLEWIVPVVDGHGVVKGAELRSYGVNVNYRFLRTAFLALPLEIGILKSLTILYMYSNNLNGSIPASLTNLTSLSSLYLWHNNLSGIIPTDIGRLHSLKILTLSENYFTGQIPTSICHLANPSVLSAGQNQLSGAIPHDIGNLRSLDTLPLLMNKLTGSIPASVGNLRNLTYLSLTGNQLTGLLPIGINNLTQLRVIYLSDNKFSGYVPQDVCRGGTLEEFVASGNRFTGRIPRSLRNCISPRSLDLSMNEL
ncbi:hypothetical protein C5167_041675, partial [Papaver somniferum]